MNFNDMLGLGKILPIDKLLEIVSGSVGKISKSYFDKKDVDTKAYEIKKLAEARAEELRIMSAAIKENASEIGGIEYSDEKLKISSSKESQTADYISISERAKIRTEFQESKKQLNIEQVTAYAAEHLKDEEPITDEPVDEDWASRFFRIVEDISNEEMQALWGKILAGEIKEPKTYSLRTLEIIRNLSKHEADVFMKISNFAIKSGKNNYLFKGSDEELLSKKHNITYNDIALMVEIGIIQAGEFISHQLLTQPNDSQRVFTCGSIVMITKIKANTPTILIPVHVFSKSGNEILKLVKSKPEMEYLKEFANSIKSDNVETQYGHILYWRGDIVHHTQPLQSF